MNGFVYLLGGSDLCAVTETVVVFLYLSALLIPIAVSYGCYLMATMFFLREQPAEISGTKTINLIRMAAALLIGSLSGFISLVAATVVFVLTYHMGRRYRASLLVRIIASLPVVRLIPYVHQKYWLPSGAPLRPRPRSFYLKRLLIRQSGLSHDIP